MILLKWIKNNRQLFKEKMVIRKINEKFIDDFFLIYDEWISLENQLNLLRQQKNLNTSMESNENSKNLKIKIQNTTKQFNGLDEKIQEYLKRFPNILDDTVPLGQDNNHNIVVNEWMEGVIPKGNKLHYQLIDHNLITQVTNMTQSRFIGLKGDLCGLHRAISNFCLDFLKQEGFIEYSLPCLLNYSSFENSGHVPFFMDDLFWLENKNLGLIPTSEVSISNILKDITFEKHQLPLKICCYSPCFRKEAGAAGRDTRGLIRLHQFHKVEMFMVTTPQDSNKFHEYMVSLVEKILKKLNLSYRTLLLCSGDTGNHSSKTYDVEVWLPLQNRWLEISSCSNIKDFSSIRLKNKYKYQQDKYFTHTLNGSCLPIERTLATILENYQYNNTIMVPEVLKPYLLQDQLTV
jgi:seryl-tRNA synthetase